MPWAITYFQPIPHHAFHAQIFLPAPQFDHLVNSSQMDLKLFSISAPNLIFHQSMIHMGHDNRPLTLKTNNIKATMIISSLAACSGSFILSFAARIVSVLK